MDKRRLRSFLQVLTQRQDLALVVLMVMTIFMMILPLPTWIVDTLIALNMSLTILLLMVGIYLKDPLEFSTLPAVILISTLFRLSLSITTTRLILTEADAGQIVETFGEFVIAGNIVVGLVVFLIITVVQFVVITKGSERIAEVSARFSLDALPGKQMSIDSDMRSGVIDMAEARARRRKLEKESQLYGSMDGAMKFVKGDAIAGLIIIAVNLIGGISVGMMQDGLSLGEAAGIYSLLTVGDGLVAQIPALFLSITAGAIVTRVTSEESSNLGEEISSQLVHHPRTIRLAAIVLVFFAFIPGFPTAIFLFLAAAFGGIGFLFYMRERKEEQEAEEAGRIERANKEDRVALTPAAPVIVEIAADLANAIDPKIFHEKARRIRQSLFADLGVPFPEVDLKIERGFGDGQYRITIENLPVAEGQIDTTKLVVRDEREHLELLDIPVIEGRAPAADLPALSVEAKHKNALVSAGVGFLDPHEVLAWALGGVLTRYAANFVGIQETRALLGSMESNYTDLVKEAQKIVPLQKMAEIFRRLVEEGVSIRNLRVVLEALVEWGQKEKDVVLLAEYVRSALKRQICHKYSDPQKVLPAFMLEHDAEEAVRGAIRHTSVGSYLALDGDIAQRLVDKVRIEIGGMDKHQVTPVVLTSLDVRRFVRNLLVSNDVDLPVLSYQDVAQEVTVHSLGSIAL